VLPLPHHQAALGTLSRGRIHFPCHSTTSHTSSWHLQCPKLATTTQQDPKRINPASTTLCDAVTAPRAQPSSHHRLTKLQPPTATPLGLYPFISYHPRLTMPHEPPKLIMHPTHPKLFTTTPLFRAESARNWVEFTWNPRGMGYKKDYKDYIRFFCWARNEEWARNGRAE